MKKHLAMLITLLLVIAVAVPAFAAVEFKYGGQFRVRWISNDNFDGTDAPAARTASGLNSTTDNQNFFDQRLRAYFTFAASENLKVVWKLEIGDVVWGMSSATGGNAIGRNGAATGGQPGADGANVETKNIYVEFNIPTTPVKGLVGIQGINLLNSWIIDDDFAAAVAKAKMDPITAQVGYVAGQNIGGNLVLFNGSVAGSTWENRIDSWFASVDYKPSDFPLRGSLVGYYQFGHNTVGSVDPTIMVTPFTNPVPSLNRGVSTIATTIPIIDPTVGGTDPTGVGTSTGAISGARFLADNFDIRVGETGSIRDNNLFDLGLNLEYKLSWLSVYGNFVKNLGSVDVQRNSLTPGRNGTRSVDYDGFMLDGGANVFCGPYTFNLGGFYTTGDERRVSAANQIVFEDTNSIGRFVYPLSSAKYFSEILGGGILDNMTTITHTNANGQRDFQWTGYQMPSNIWTVTAGAAWQVLEQTKLSASYWYFGTSEDVETVRNRTTLRRQLANDIGHELDFYVTQGIVDGLTLDLVGAYLITGDAYTAARDTADVYELGARLQWSF